MVMYKNNKIRIETLTIGYIYLLLRLNKLNCLGLYSVKEFDGEDNFTQYWFWALMIEVRKIK